MKAIDVKDQTFYQLTAIERVGLDKHRSALWLWKCTCGKTKVLPKYRVTSGNDKSCGCRQTENGRKRGKMNLGKNGNSAKNHAVNSCRRSAKYRGHEWTLSREYAETVLSSPCHYCGAAPAKINETGSGIFIHGGIDRVDSDKGYIPGNVVPACFTCNAMKLDHSLKFFTDHIKKMVQHLHLGENLRQS